MDTRVAILSAILVGPLLYLLVASFAQPARSLPDYFYAERSLKPSDFIDTTFMYGVQIAALSLFVTWGYIYGAWSFFVPLFWGLGYLLFSAALFIPAIRKAFLSSSFGTLHSFLGNVHGSRSISIFAAIITLIALAGPAMFEPHFTAGVIAHGLGFQDAQLENIQILCFIGFVAISAAYLVIGGFRTVVITNQWQLAIGYTAFNFLLGALLVLLNTPAIKDRAIYAALFLLASATLLALSVAIQIVQKRADILSTFCHVVSTAWLLFVLFYKLDGTFAVTEMLSFIGGQFTKPFVWYAMISLLTANGFYQFVDVGQWQRVLSLEVAGSSNEQAQIRSIALSNLVAGVASSISWCVAILFGLVLRSAFPTEEPFSVLSTLLNRLGPFTDSWIAFLFVTALIAIMFSTLDALCSAVSFTIQYDLFRGRNIFFARALTIGILCFYIFYFLALKLVARDQLDTILYASWSLQIGLLPAVIAALFAKRFFVATGCSLCGGVIGATILFPLGMSGEIFELAPLFALAGACIGFVGGIAFDFWRANRVAVAATPTDAKASDA